MRFVQLFGVYGGVIQEVSLTADGFSLGQQTFDAPGEGLIQCVNETYKTVLEGVSGYLTTRQGVHIRKDSVLA